jgi:hypothetical protein
MMLRHFDVVRKRIEFDEVYYALLRLVWRMVESPHHEAHLIHRFFYPRARKRRFDF